MKKRVTSPQPPKKPLNAFFLYSKKRRQALTESEIALPMHVQNKVIREEFTNLPPLKKKFFEKKAALLILKWQRELATYIDQHPDDFVLPQPTRIRKHKINGFFVFRSEIIDQIKRENPDLNNRELIMLVSAKWKALSSSEKEAYSKQPQDGPKEEVDSDHETSPIKL